MSRARQRARAGAPTPSLGTATMSTTRTKMQDQAPVRGEDATTRPPAPASSKAAATVVDYRLFLNGPRKLPPHPLLENHPVLGSHPFDYRRSVRELRKWEQQGSSSPRAAGGARRRSGASTSSTTTARKSRDELFPPLHVEDVDAAKAEELKTRPPPGPAAMAIPTGAGLLQEFAQHEKVNDSHRSATGFFQVRDLSFNDGCAASSPSFARPAGRGPPVPASAEARKLEILQQTLERFIERKLEQQQVQEDQEDEAGRRLNNSVPAKSVFAPFELEDAPGTSAATDPGRRSDYVHTAKRIARDVVECEAEMVDLVSALDAMEIDDADVSRHVDVAAANASAGGTAGATTTVFHLDAVPTRKSETMQRKQVLDGGNNKDNVENEQEKNDCGGGRDPFSTSPVKRRHLQVEAHRRENPFHQERQKQELDKLRDKYYGHWALSKDARTGREILIDQDMVDVGDEIVKEGAGGAVTTGTGSGASRRSWNKSPRRMLRSSGIFLPPDLDRERLQNRLDACETENQQDRLIKLLTNSTKEEVFRAAMRGLSCAPRSSSPRRPPGPRSESEVVHDHEALRSSLSLLASPLKREILQSRSLSPERKRDALRASLGKHIAENQGTAALLQSHDVLKMLYGESMEAAEFLDAMLKEDKKRQAEQELVKKEDPPLLEKVDHNVESFGNHIEDPLTRTSVFELYPTEEAVGGEGGREMNKAEAAALEGGIKEQARSSSSSRNPALRSASRAATDKKTASSLRAPKSYGTTAASSKRDVAMKNAKKTGTNNRGPSTKLKNQMVNALKLLEDTASLLTSGDGTDDVRQTLG